MSWSVFSINSKFVFFTCAIVPTKIINARTLIPNNLYFIHDSLQFLYKINQFHTNKEDRLVYQIHDKIPVTKWRTYSSIFSIWHTYFHQSTVLVITILSPSLIPAKYPASSKNVFRVLQLIFRITASSFLISFSIFDQTPNQIWDDEIMPQGKVCSEGDIYGTHIWHIVCIYM